MDVTIAICTRDRAGSLNQTLNSLRQLEVPFDLDWEVLIIDNGSLDYTADVVEAHAGSLPLRMMQELKAGLSNARNRAVDLALGSYLIWTDDDVSVDRDWLTAYLDAFRRHPNGAVFGGKILPDFESSPPSWLAQSICELEPMLARRDFGDEELPLSNLTGVLPFGANYAVKKREQNRFRYDAKLGAGPGRSRVGEESQVIKSILHAGGSGYWVPGAVVWHRIPRERQTLRYVLSYYMGHGETRVVLEGATDVSLIFGAPRWLWRRLGTVRE